MLWLCMPVDTKAGFATMRSEDFKQGAGMKLHYVMPVGKMISRWDGNSIIMWIRQT